jgi:hypothetical protein
MESPPPGYFRMYSVDHNSIASQVDGPRPVLEQRRPVEGF